MKLFIDFFYINLLYKEVDRKRVHSQILAEEKFFLVAFLDKNEFVSRDLFLKS